MVDIRTNLLKNRQTLSEKDYQKEKTYLKWSVIGSVVVVVIVVALSAWNLVLTSQLSGIEGAVTATSKEMQGLVQASAQQVYLKSRLKLVTGFLADRSLARESLQKIFTTTIEGVHVSGVAFEEESILGVNYVANSPYALNQVLSYYQTDTGYFTQVVSRGLSRSKDGTYQLSLALTLPKGEK